jgi:cysteine synthase A
MNKDYFLKISKTLPSVADAIGITPLVALDRLTKDYDGRILAKLEYLNPGFSKKDRPALQIILDAEEKGILKSGDTIVELTSGNMGTGLAIVALSRGYKFIAVMSKGNSQERALMMQALGAKVYLVDQHKDSVPGKVNKIDLELAENEAERLTEELNAFRVDQWNRKGNFKSHYEGTAPEIWYQSDGNINGFCDFIGSGGTFGGCAAFFKEQNNNIKCYAIEPEGAPVLAGQDVTNLAHPIQGGGYARDNIAHLEGVHPDGFITVNGEEAKQGVHMLAEKEGIFSGYSSGANVIGALKLIEDQLKGATIAIVICDSGLKYMSTELWS